MNVAEFSRVYPPLNASVGLTAIARRAGIHDASAATPVSSTATPPSVTGSVTPTFTSSERIN